MKKNAEPQYLKIEDGIPPPNLCARRSPTGLAVRALKPGQSVLTKQNTGAASAMANDLFGAGNYRVAREDNGTRIWRLK